MSSVRSKKKSLGRTRRRRGVRNAIRPKTPKPRILVHKTQKYTYAQLVSADNKVLYGCSTKVIKDESSSSISVASAKQLGEAIGKWALDNGLEAIVFDRNGYKYHGRVSAVADGAREAGLKF